MAKYKYIKNWEFPEDQWKWVGLDYDYDRTKCVCTFEYDSYCRCSQIINGRINDLNIDSICNHIFDSYKKERTSLKKFNEGIYIEYPDILFKYCIDRILRINKCYDKDNWELVIIGGYYGEEVSGLRMDNYSLVKDQIEKCYKLSDNERIPYILELEYGYLRDDLVNKEWKLAKVNSKDLKMPNKDHYAKISNFYKEYDLPLGVYLQDGDKYRLVDGYHRFPLRFTQDKCSIIVGY